MIGTCRACPLCYASVVMTPDPTDKDAMKYAIFGGEDMSTEEKLSKYTGEVNWSYLAPHYQNDSLYFVDPTLKLEDVGAAFSGNRKKQVETWVKSGDLVKIEALHAMQWEGTDTLFQALVVSPFVLCRPVE